MGQVMILLLRMMSYLFWIQPRKLQLFFGNCLGMLGYWARFRVTVVNQNLAIAFPGQVELQKKILRASYQHLGNLILEILLVVGPLKKFVLKYVDITGIEHIEAAKKRGKGLVFLSSHVGNWEVMAASGGLLTHSDLLLVTKHLKPEWVHESIEAGRLQCQIRATYEPKTLRDVLSHLKKNGAVGFVLDQYAGPPVGVRVPLFGIPVGTPLIVATLAKRTGATLLPVENFRKEDGRWQVNVKPPLEWKSFSNAHYELAANTAEYAAVIEKMILAHPEQWLWTHRRFKGDLSPLREAEWNEPRVRK